LTGAVAGGPQGRAAPAYDPAFIDMVKTILGTWKLFFRSCYVPAGEPRSPPLPDGRFAPER